MMSLRSPFAPRPSLRPNHEPRKCLLSGSDTPTHKAPQPSKRAIETRRRLLEVAEEVFLQNGYEHSSLRDIARRVGASSGAIYFHFLSKAELLSEVIKIRFLSDLARGSNDDGSIARPDARPRANVKRVGASVAKRAKLRRLLLQGAAPCHAEPELKALLKATQEEALERFAQTLVGWQEEGTLVSDVDARDLTVFFWCAELGLVFLECCDIPMPKSVEWSEIVERAMSAFETAD